MKKLCTLFAASLLLLGVFFSTESRASHIVGMDITYEYTGIPNQYILTARLYRDCAGITAPTTLSLCYSSISCGLNGTVIMNQIPGTGQQIPIPPCIPNPGPTSCQGGTSYGVQEYIYTATVTLPQACNDWVFAWTQCCRNAQITTLNGAGGQGLYVSTTVDNLNYPTNSSPVFATLPVTQFCVNSQFYYIQNATDVDGDSLAYFLVDCEDANGGCPITGVGPVIYNAGFSGTVPFTTANGVVIDPTTGVINFFPTVAQVGVMAVLVREYRNGVEIGSVKRDIQVSIAGNCIINPPVFNTDSVQWQNNIYLGAQYQCGDTAVIIALQEPVQCGSIESAGTDFRVLAPNGQPNPTISAVAINCTNGFTDSILLYLNYPLTYGITHIWTKQGFDGNTLLSECGSAMAEYDTFDIVIDDTTQYQLTIINDAPCAFIELDITVNEAIACYTFANDGSDVAFFDSNGTLYPVVSVTSPPCNLGNPYVNQFHLTFANTVSGNPPYYFTTTVGTDSSTVANSCGKFLFPGDTIAIIYTLNYILVNIGSDQTICSTDTFPILNSNIPSLNYNWTLNGNSVGTNQTLQTTAGGTYIVNVSAGPACSGSDTMNLNVVQAPVVSLNDATICDYDALPVLDAGNAGATYSWTLNGNPVGSNQTLQTSAAGTYMVTVNVGSCDASASMNLTINASPIATLTDATICQGDQHVFDVGNPGATYAWSNGATDQTITVNGAGSYSVIVTNAANCIDTASANLTVAQYPAPPIVICDPSPGTQYAYVYSWLADPNITNYQVSIDSGLTWIAPNVSNTQHGVNAPVPFFIVQALNSGPCNPSPASAFSECEVEVEIPNVITPDNDGKNDVFFIKNLDKNPNSSLQIFNRWGNEIYSSGSYQNDWKAADQPAGTYFYILRLQNQKVFSGNITVIKK
ncbi:MAG TPA: gliding motility-associated C-terminal domain-containing protein [Bacteroidia bacterium]|nr:gliding motility-associated C-terminal domain-containing protein [Bacteroidia bacterium]HNT81104.1 gliding motility-associated C-terminal domain-containing protein [Bacteroidia bacterium]